MLGEGSILVPHIRKEREMLKPFAKILVPMALAAGLPAIAAAQSPTIVLVHGAFADSSSWGPVIDQLQGDGYAVIAAANPLRAVPGDSASVAALLGTVEGPIILVGHSYGGVLMTNAALGNAQVKGLVYVSAFAPDKGESAFQLTSQFPGSLLGGAVLPASLGSENADLYIAGDKFRAVFAADLPEAETARMAVTQRPVTQAALTGASGEPAWKTLPSWFVYGDADQAIPAAALAFMADRAQSLHTVVVPGASHALLVSDPEAVVAVIEEAATATVSN
jgi:pimeloyl-ACP methyl ester carboxylesterase